MGTLPTTHAFVPGRRFSAWSQPAVGSSGPSLFGRTGFSGPLPERSVVLVDAFGRVVPHAAPIDARAAALPVRKRRRDNPLRAAPASPAGESGQPSEAAVTADQSTYRF